MSDASRPLVLLLRSASDPDPYVQALDEAGYEATCEPVLHFKFVHQEALAGRLAHPHRYGGLICTSPRAAEALADALRWLPDQVAAWQARPAYAVGPRTAEVLREIGFDPEGADSGTAEALAARIAQAERVEGEPAEAPLLFLAGNRRRDVLPRALDAAGITFEEQCAYETHVRTDLDLSAERAPQWAVFFSPSGIEAARQATGIDWRAVRTAAIGPTTAGALEEAGWTAEAVAAQPTPEALAAALRKT